MKCERITPLPGVIHPRGSGHARWRMLASVLVLVGLLLSSACREEAQNQTVAPAVPEPPPTTAAQEEESAVEYVLLETSKGDILLELNREKAPLTVKNFIEYAREGFYDGTIFHRVMPGFMIQGGGFAPDMRQKTTRGNIRNESSNGLTNDRGTIAMARTGEPHSASSQFFINVADNTFLNRAQAQDGWGYAVFGKVIAGMDAVDAIVSVPTKSVGMHEAVPQTPITINNAAVLTEKEARDKQAEMEG